MNKIYTFIALLFSVALFAQEEKKIDANNDLKLAQLPYYNYGKGLGMTSADSIFQLNIRFRMQNRITSVNNEDEKSKYEGEIRRLRLRLDGYVGNPQFLYVIQLSFAPRDMGKQKDNEAPNIIRDAALTYRPKNSDWSFIFGQTKLPGNRQRTNSSGALQLTDRSINNAKFNIDRDFGIQAYYLKEKKDAFGYNVKTAVSTGKGRNWSGSSASDSYALTGRLELFPLGEFKNNGAFFEGDLARETKPKLMVSGTFSYNNNASKTRGQTGEDLFQPKSFRSIMGDAILKYNGWAAMASYMSRYTSDPITSQLQDNGEYLKSAVFAGHGMDFQLSYLFPSNYELIGRVSQQNMHKDLYKQLNMPNTTEFTLGATKYLWEHAFKIQAELTYDRLSFDQKPSKDNWYFRVQFEIGI
ncbi:porin family protein [Myroides pelagicus]|uniref:Porin n=1 Tax=Myroides pelagicus TaxID=270914 RepID=A0A7K1GLM5_9FLAO|nr:porin [Myroides pelagicus]MEC4114293.1 porin [Myroides pelagicus]MTH29343.1 porin [Myroides pelagicus]